MNVFDQIVTKIIKEQALIIGPLAWYQAGKVPGIHVVNQKPGEATIEGSDRQTVVNTLVSKYESLFGLTAREVAKEAVGSILADLSPSDVPSSLR